MSGKLIVFEGTDGSGKATQTALLCRELESRGVPFRKLEFPRYKEESSALLRLYLSGPSAPTRRTSMPMPPPRFSPWYATPPSSRTGAAGTGRGAGHRRPVHHQQRRAPDLQAASLQERQAFLDWLFDFEYRKLGLPEPDRVLYLDVPTELSEQMMRRREQLTHTTADIHERDEAYLRSLPGERRHGGGLRRVDRIDCARDGQVRSVDDIHREVMERLRDLLKGVK